MRAAFIALLVGIFSACATPDRAEQGSSWYVNDAPAPDTHWRKTDGPFGAQLFITDDAKSVYDFWVNEKGGVPIKRLDRAAAGAHVETIVFFIRCAPSRDGKCSVRGFLTVTRSDGKVLARDQELLLYGKPPPEGFNLGISEANAGLELEDFDGSYLFEMRVLDAVANREVRLSQRIAVER